MRPEGLGKKVKSKAIPVTGLGGLLSSEMLRITHCLDNRLTDVGKVASPTLRPTLIPRNIITFMLLVLISVRG
jgi:hypothetical protein